MRRASFADMHCSIAQALEVIGEWWTLLILRDAFLGVTRFDDFADRLGIARNVLAVRLDTLVAAGVLDPEPYDQARGRYDYVLTDKGKALWPVLVAIEQWGDEWIFGPGREPLALVHTTCGHRARAEMRCDHCGEPLRLADLRAVPGPGGVEEGFIPPRRS